MKKQLLIIVFFCLISVHGLTQENPLEKFDLLIGHWEGNGEGFSSNKSKIQSEFNWIMNKQFIEVKNHSEFDPTEAKPESEVHKDWGIISFDKARKKIVFRQFHIEGFVNQYILNDTLSSEKSFVFESEIIENFVPGGKARFTIQIHSNSEIETLFDVGFPGKEMACFGRNLLKKN